MARVRESSETDERLLFGGASQLPIALEPTQAHPIAPRLRARTPAFLDRLNAAKQTLFWRDYLRAKADLEISRGTAFHFIPVLMGAGSIAYFALAQEPSLLPIALTIVLSVLCVFLLAHRTVLRMAMAAALVSASGMLFAKLETMRQETILLGEQISTRVLGRILTIDKSGSAQRAIVEVIATERPALKYQPERIKVTLRDAPPDLAAGDGIEALFLLRPPGGPVRPGSFDFAFDSYFDRIGASGVSISKVEPAAIAPASLFWRVRFWFEHQRIAIAERVRSRIPGQAGEMSAALIAGLTGGISAQTNEDMRASGLAHVTSISGLHMALVAGAVLGAVRFALAVFPGFASRRSTKKIAAVFALMAALAYYFLSGGGVATFRSFIMMAVMLAAVLFDRPALTMRNLVIAAIIILAFTPHEIMGPSFQMSFSATAALVASYQIYARWRLGKNQPAPPDRHFLHRLPRQTLLFLVGLAATSLVAGSATAIYSAFHFNRVAPAGLLANLAAMPPVSLIVMPMALISVLLMPFGLEALPLYCMGFGVQLMLDIAAYFATMPLTGATGIMPAASLVLLTIALLLFCLLSTSLRLAALPVAAIGLMLLPLGRPPDILISEDSKLVAVRGQGSQLYVNRQRPNRFTADNWTRAYGASALLPPEGEGFTCAPGLCQLATPEGVSIARIEDKALLWAACEEFDLLVVAFPMQRRTCGEGKAYVISARDLARLGSVEVRITNGQAQKGFAVTRALAGIDRPWHRHRAFSRAARDLDPYVPKPKPPATVQSSGPPPA